MFLDYLLYIVRFVCMLLHIYLSLVTSTFSKKKECKINTSKKKQTTKMEVIIKF